MKKSVWLALSSFVVVSLVFAAGASRAVWAATSTLPHKSHCIAQAYIHHPCIVLKPTFVVRKRSLEDILNASPKGKVAPPKQIKGPLSSLSQALVIKPDLGACQSFINGCHEGDIVTMPNDNVMQTVGAGLGLRIGAIRFEYAHGLHSGANFIGIRSRIP